MALITRDPEVMHGAPCFTGTRVAVRTLFDHFEAGYSVEQFLAEFPTVSRSQVNGLLDQMRQSIERATASETP